MLNKDQNEPGSEELEANDMLLFLAGEMNAEAQSRFEQRLMDEPQLALALSEAIEVEAVLGVSEPLAPVTPQSPFRSEPRRSALLVVAAVAACMLVAVFVIPKAVQTRSVPVVVNDAVETEQPAEFVDLWLETIAVSEPDVFEPEEEPIELAMLDPVDVMASEADDVVPGWMYVAFEEDASVGVTVE